jgi:polyisoprenoid-binding protein YceI
MFAPVCARLLTLALPASLSLSIAATALAQDATPVEIHGGTAVFDVETNVSAISVHGKSTALDGRARVRQTDQGLAIEQIEATIPAASLSTGMGLRDTHMRKYVFTTADGQMPDLRFEASQAACSGGRGRDVTCQLSGALAIRGVIRPLVITLHVSVGDSITFRASSDTTISLSAWGIERPAQLGVQTSDEVKLHLEFTGRPVASLTTAAYRGGR